MNEYDVLLLHAKCFTRSNCLFTHDLLITEYVLALDLFPTLTYIFLLISGQGFGLHDDLSRRMPPLTPSLASRAQEPPMQQPTIMLNNTNHHWSPSPTDTRCKFWSPSSAFGLFSTNFMNSYLVHLSFYSCLVGMQTGLECVLIVENIPEARCFVSRLHHH